MRILTAIVAIVLGAAALVAGIGQKTFWAPSESLTAAIPGSVEEAPLTVIESGVDEVNDDPIEITVRGEGEFFMALGRSSDVDAWVGDAAVNRVTEVDTEQNVLKTVHEGSEETVPTPKYSDLWVARDTVEGETVYTWTEPEEGDWSLLLAADGTEPAPTDISVEWPNTASTPFALALIVLGALLVLVGLLRLVWPSKPSGRDSAGSEGKPQEAAQAKGGDGVAKRIIATAAAAALTFGGTTAAQATETEDSSASASPSESASESASPSASPSADDEDASPSHPVLLGTQLERIVTGVTRAIEAGDKELDGDLLKGRLAGRALAARSLNYEQLEEDVADVEKLAPIGDPEVLTSAVPTSPEWPRSVMAVTQNGEDAPRVLTLTQMSPRSNYKLIQNTGMVEGPGFPGIPVGDPSVQKLDPDEAGDLEVAPSEAIKQLVRYLNDPDADEAKLFAETAYVDKIHEFQRDVTKEAEEDGLAEVEFKRNVDAGVRALSTPDNGAIVTFSLRWRHIVTPAEEGGTIKVGNEEEPKFTDLAGAAEHDGPVTTTYMESFALHIPASGSDDKISFIAAENHLQTITLDD